MSINGITTSQVLLIHQLRYMNVLTPQEPLYPTKRFSEIFEMYSVPTALYIFYLSSFFLYIKIHIGEAKQCKKKEHLYFKMRMVHGGHVTQTVNPLICTIEYKCHWETGIITMINGRCYL